MRDVLHLRTNDKGCFGDAPVDQAAPSTVPNTHACPWRLWREIPSTCPFLIMFAASIP